MACFSARSACEEINFKQTPLDKSQMRLTVPILKIKYLKSIDSVRSIVNGCLISIDSHAKEVVKRPYVEYTRRDINPGGKCCYSAISCTSLLVHNIRIYVYKRP